MRINAQIDDMLWQQVMHLSGQSNPQEVLTEVLREYIQLRQAQHVSTIDWVMWQAENQALTRQILHRRSGEGLNVDALLSAAREDLENGDDGWIGH